MPLSDLVRQRLTDKRWLIENLIKIVDRDSRRLVPFRFRPAQEKYWHERTSADIVLKARQLGFSTLVKASHMIDAITIPNTTVVVLAQEDSSGIEHMRQIHDFYDNLPDVIVIDGTEIDIKPSLETESQHTLVFKDVGGRRLGSKIRVGTAGSLRFGRGESISRALLTEAGFYEPGTLPEIIAAVEGAAPPTGAEIVIETTANGASGDFYKLVQETKRGGTGFRLHTVEWYRDPNYRMPPDDPRANELGIIEIEPTDEESRLMLRNGLDVDQIRFRRFKMLKIGEKFAQEMLEDDVTAFIRSGSGVFDPESIIHYTGMMRPPVRESGGLRTWIPPKPGQRYIVACDVSEGMSERADYSVGIVLNAQTLEHCATLRGHFGTTEFTWEAIRTAELYNNALLSMERPPAGGGGSGAAIKILEQAGYQNTYIHPDDGRIGWPVNAGTKPLMLDEGRTIINNKLFVTYDDILVGELNSFIEMPRTEGRSKFGAPKGSHDDTVMALLQAFMVRWSVPDIAGTTVYSYGR